MNTISKYYLGFTIMSIFLTAELFSSCSVIESSSREKFLSSTVVPAAEGYVQVKQDKNNNFNIKVNVWNLADPSKLDPSKKNYVVWMETIQDETKNIGLVKSSQAALSKALKASFETVSPIKPRKIFISAEDGENIEAPGGQVVLTTDVLK